MFNFSCLLIMKHYDNYIVSNNKFLVSLISTFYFITMDGNNCFPRHLPFFYVKNRKINIYPYWTGGNKLLSLRFSADVRNGDFLFAELYPIDVSSELNDKVKISKAYRFFACSLQEFEFIFNNKSKWCRKYYAVMVHEKRSLYFDIDFVLNITNELHITNWYLQLLHKIICLRHGKSKSKQYVWIANRQNYDGTRFSFHIIYPDIIFNNLDTMKYYVQDVKIKIYNEIKHNLIDLKMVESKHTIKQLKQQFKKAVDTTVYNQPQFWKLPLCAGIKYDSTLLPHQNTNLTFIDSIKLNFMNCTLNTLREYINQSVFTVENTTIEPKSITKSNLQSFDDILMHYPQLHNYSDIFKQSIWNDYSNTVTKYQINNCTVACINGHDKQSRYGPFAHFCHSQVNNMMWINIRCNIQGCKSMTRLSMTPFIKYPWQFQKFQLPESIIIDIDQFLCQIENQHQSIIYLPDPLKYFWLKDVHYQINPQFTCVKFSTFFMPEVKCTVRTEHNQLKLEYRSKHNILLCCKMCNKSIIHSSQ